MATITRQELNASIDTVFNDSIPDESLKPSAEGTELKKVADYIDQEFKEYSIVFIQTGTAVPIEAEVFRNTIGSLAWSRQSIGNYVLTGVGLFPIGKTKITPMNMYAKLQGKSWFIYHESEDVVRMIVRNDAGAFADLNISDGTDLTLKIYP